MSEYTSSQHYRDDPEEEVKAALAAGNTTDSVRDTLEARQQTEERREPRDEEAIKRLIVQKNYLIQIINSVGGQNGRSHHEGE